MNNMSFVKSKRILLFVYISLVVVLVSGGILLLSYSSIDARVFLGLALQDNYLAWGSICAIAGCYFVSGIYETWGLAFPKKKNVGV